jgi:hypothetical protein
MSKLCLAKRVNKVNNMGEFPLVVSLVAHLGTNQVTNKEKLAIGFSSEDGTLYHKIYQVDLSKGSELYNDLNEICGDSSFTKNEFDYFSILGKPVIGNIFVQLYIKKSNKIMVKNSVPYYIFSFDCTDDIDKMPIEILNEVKKSIEWMKIVFNDYIY